MVSQEHWPFRPSVLLLDEPTSALDPELVMEVLSIIQKLAREEITMVLVTHEIAFAKDVASRILFLDDAKVAADGSPEEILVHPILPRLQQFLRRSLEVISK